MTIFHPRRRVQVRRWRREGRRSPQAPYLIRKMSGEGEKAVDESGQQFQHGTRVIPVEGDEENDATSKLLEAHGQHQTNASHSNNDTLQETSDTSKNFVDNEYEVSGKSAASTMSRQDHDDTEEQQQKDGKETRGPDVSAQSTVVDTCSKVDQHGNSNSNNKVEGDEDVEMAENVDVASRTWRVKLYQLREDDGQWADNGTGHVTWSINNREGESSTTVYGSQSGVIHLKVTDEKPPHRILYEGGFERDLYSKQGDTIITWQEESREGAGPIDLALSFQDREGCNEVWSSIQESCRFSTGALSFGTYGVGNGDDADTQGGDGTDKAKSNVYIDEIPADIQSSDLLHVYRVLDRASPNNLLGSYCTEKNKDFIQQLLCCFEELEKEKGDPDIDKFHILFHIFRHILHANSPDVLETLLLDEHWLIFVGILEYNPDCSLQQSNTISSTVDILSDNGQRTTGERRYDYRRYLQEKSNFKQVAPIQNRQIIKKIHMNYRLEYLLHCIEGIMSDELRQTATSMQIYNNNDIIQMISNDKVFIAGILAALGNSDAKLELQNLQQLVPPVRVLMPKVEPSRLDVLMCLKELCKLATQMQLTTRSNFYLAFYQEGGFTKGGGSLFDAVGNILGDMESSISERQNACEVLIFCVTHEPATLRKYLCTHGQHPIVKHNDGETSTLLNQLPKKPGHLNQTKIENQVGGDIPLNANARHIYENGDLGDRNCTARLENDSKMSTLSKTVATQVVDNARGAGGSFLLQQLCARLTGDNCESIQAQCRSILEFLLDTETMEPNEKEDFIATFHDYYIPLLLDALSRAPGDDSLAGDTDSEYYSATQQSAGDRRCGINANSESNSKLHNISLFGMELNQDSVSARASWVNIVNLLSFCVKRHQYRIKSFMLHNDVVAKVLQLLNCREKYVKLTAIRFVRTCVSLRDDIYHNKMVKNNLLKPIFRLFVENGPKDNLINSTIIELVDFIVKNDIGILASYIVNQFHRPFNPDEKRKEVEFDFGKIEYVKTFRALLEIVNGQQVHPSNDSKVASSSDDALKTQFADVRQKNDLQKEGVSNTMEVEKEDDQYVDLDNSTFPLKRSRSIPTIMDINGNVEQGDSKRRKMPQGKSLGEVPL